MTHPWPPSHTLRLARLARPELTWEVKRNPLVAFGLQDSKFYLGDQFNADSLDDLARVEQRVCAAGFDDELAQEITHAMLDDGVRNAWATFATPDQRRRALIAVMDANPEIEERK